MLKHYILDGHKAVEADFLDWAQWFEIADRTVAKTDVGEAQVSTVFLGLDHNFDGGPPFDVRSRSGDYSLMTKIFIIVGKKRADEFTVRWFARMRVPESRTPLELAGWGSTKKEAIDNLRFMYEEKRKELAEENKFRSEEKLEEVDW